MPLPRELVLLRIAVLVWSIGSGVVPAQSQWTAAGAPFKQSPVQQVVSSPGGDRIWFCSRLALDSGNWSEDNSILEYTNGQWDTIGTFPAPLIYSAVEYHDTLLIASAYQLIDDGTTDVRIAYWNGGEWKRYGSVPSGPVRRLRVLEDTLYAIGGMDTLDGRFVNGIGKRVGGQWEPVGQPFEDQDASFLDAVALDGDLYAVCYAYTGDERGLYRMAQGQGPWQLVDGGVQGGLCGAQSIAVYQNEVYIGGQITVACGNAGQGIMRLVNDQWASVDLGLQRNPGDNENFSGANALVVHDGLLWAGGYFRFAGGIEAKGLATWDGTEWCSVPGNFSDGLGHNGIMGMDFYYDTLFVSANMVDGDSVNFAAKFIGESYAGPCSSELHVSQQHISGPFVIFPNPATTSIRFTPPLGQKEQARIVDALGRIVIQLFGQVTELDVSSWPRGMYTVHSASRAYARFVLN